MSSHRLISIMPSDIMKIIRVIGCSILTLLHPSAGPLTKGCNGLPVTNYYKASKRLKTMPQNVILWAYA